MRVEPLGGEATEIVGIVRERFTPDLEKQYRLPQNSIEFQHLSKTIGDVDPGAADSSSRRTGYRAVGYLPNELQLPDTQTAGWERHRQERVHQYCSCPCGSVEWVLIMACPRTSAAVLIGKEA